MNTILLVNVDESCIQYWYTRDGNLTWRRENVCECADPSPLEYVLK